MNQPSASPKFPRFQRPVKNRLIPRLYRLNPAFSRFPTPTRSFSTLITSGGTADTLGVVVKANGVFEPVTGQTLRSVRCENGGILRLTAFEPVTVKENVNLGEINLAWPANLSLAGSPRWRTVLVSKTGFTGEFASTSQPCVSRVVETGDGFALQLKRVDGLVISFR